MDLSKDQLHEVCVLLDKYQFQVELLPSQAEQYFGKQTNAMKKGSWKKLSVDYAKIPKSAAPQKSSGSDDKRKKAKALLLKMKMAKSKGL
jgi:hypothetical protein